MKPLGAMAALCLAGCLAGQQSSRDTATYVYDGMGNRSLATSSSSARSGSASQNIERVRSVNGREIPLESVKENVISDRDGVRVVERIVRRYDADGTPGPPIKLRIEERTAADGSTSTATSVYRGDINGNYQLSQKTVEQTQKIGDQTTVTRSVERPTLNATTEVVEKSTSTTTEKDNSSHSESVTYRRDANGSFFAAKQEVADSKKTQGGPTVETVTVYESESTGKMRLQSQQVSTTTTAPDGSERREVDVYNAAVPGMASSADAPKPQLRERQIVERKTDANGAVVETISVQRPSLSDPNRLGGARKISETICRGCDPPKKP